MVKHNNEGHYFPYSPFDKYIGHLFKDTLLNLVFLNCSRPLKINFELVNDRMKLLQLSDY